MNTPSTRTNVNPARSLWTELNDWKIGVTSGVHFAHYTSAENVLNIINGQKLWLRSAAVMNDYSEITHGRACVDYMLDDDVGARFRAAIDAAHPGLWSDIEKVYRKNPDALLKQVYITSLCEHELMDEDGVLSMWRAYGGRTSGAAVVFNRTIINEPVPNARVHSSKVMYVDKAQFNSQFRRVVDRLQSNPDILGRESREDVKEMVISTLIFITLSCKHMGFREEREWRLLYLAFQHDDDSPVEKSSVSIGGIPQIIYKAPLHQDPSKKGHSFENLLERIIVGPTLYPEVVRDGLHLSLSTKGVSDPLRRIAVSSIPLRQWG